MEKCYEWSLTTFDMFTSCSSLLMQIHISPLFTFKFLNGFASRDFVGRLGG